MLKISAPYTIDTENKLVMSSLTWPERCACCGCTHGLKHVNLMHAARYSSSTTVTATYRTTSTSGYYLSWPVPYCEHCLKHQRKARNPIQAGLLLVVGFLIAFGVGYALFEAGYSDNYAVVGAYAALLGLMALAGWRLHRRVGAARLRQATRMMAGDCTNPAPAVSVASDMACILYTFSNEHYAQDFASANGL